MENLTVSNTVEDVHNYCIDWTEDTLTWSIDGKDARTLNRKDTWNATANRFDYPQTPARVMLSLWPAGLPTNGKGTIEWAGGEIDWNSPYMQNGYYYAMVKEVTVECYDPPQGTKGSGQTSYIYTDRAATNNTVQLTNKQVILGSLYASGEDPDEGKVSSGASSAPEPTKSVALVPGGNPGGGNRAEDQTSAAAQASATGNGDNGNPAQPTQNAGNGGSGFVQGGGGQGAGTSLQPGLGKVGGGAVAIVVAILGLMVL
jgi:hypothetical protein